MAELMRHEDPDADAEEVLQGQLNKLTTRYLFLQGRWRKPQMRLLIKCKASLISKGTDVNIEKTTDVAVMV